MGVFGSGGKGDSWWCTGTYGQYGHVTGLHGDTIVEVLRRRAPKPEPESEPEMERGRRPENRDFPL